MEDPKLPLMYSGPRDLDRLVAEKVMGLRRDPEPKTDVWLCRGEDGFHHECPHYSTSIEDAWKVLEHFYTGYGKDWNVNLFTDQGEIRSWFCEFEWISTSLKYVEEGETPMEAICLAALSAVSK